MVRNVTPVLGIDLACRRWADIGTARLEPVAGTRARATSPALVFPKGDPDPRVLAGLIDAHCRKFGVGWVALDGPHAWRDPASTRPGAGRWCEKLARAQGKTGVAETALPRTQLRWTRFCIEVFDALLAMPGVWLAGDGPSGHAYGVLETFPTATWRALGLSPLPGKAAARVGGVEAWRERLEQAAGLSVPAGLGHDDLQAVVAALPAWALAGGGVRRAMALGDPARLAGGKRAEGLIWTLSDTE